MVDFTLRYLKCIFGQSNLTLVWVLSYQSFAVTGVRFPSSAMFVLQGLQAPKLRGNQAASSEIQDGYDEKTLSKAPSLRPVVGKHRKCGGQPLLTTWGGDFFFGSPSDTLPHGLLEKSPFFNHTSTDHSTRKDPASIGVLVS